jgi:glutathione S-transferase
MKLYYHPVSTTSRPVLLFAAEHGLAPELQPIDLFTGEHMQPAFAVINPSRQVPVLEDGEFRLTESAAILKYLAEKTGSEAYPREPQARARVNELADWFNCGLSRELCYGFIYPQLFPHLKRPSDEAQASTLAWARPNARRWLDVLDESLIGPSREYLGGARPCLADYSGVAMVTLGEAVHIDYSHWRNITRWIANMKSRPSWAPSNAAFYEYVVAPLADKSFEPL